MPSEIVDPDDESQFPAAPEQYNSAPITLGRFGAYVRSTAETTATTPTSSWVNALTNNTTNPSFSFSGVLSEVIVFNRKLSETERQQVYAYLSQKYNLNDSLPKSFDQSRNSAYQAGLTFWDVENHPNKKNLDELPFVSQFAGLTLESFFSVPDMIYKSVGTRLADGTTLASDTYTNIGL